MSPRHLPAAILFACAATSCADEPTLATTEGDLPWELDTELDSDLLPACPPDQPDCDRIDEPDIAEEGAPVDPSDYEGVALEGGGLETAYDDVFGDGGSRRGLADPKTSTGKFRVWPRGRIPYRFLKNSSGSYQLNSATRTRISQAMTNWEVLTEGRIKFRARASTDTAYVNVRLGSSRVSPFVGYRAGQVQQLYLRQDEPITVIKHELGHVVGFHHEQRRSDRLDLIQVRTANIVQTDLCRFQFSVCSTCAKVGPYDRSSVMHYRTTDLANCRTGPVLLKKDGTAIGHVWKLSTRDVSSVAAMYPLPASPTPGPIPLREALPETGSLVADGGCASVADDALTDGARVIATGCAGAGSQDWRATRYGQLRAKHSLRCSAVAGDAVPGAPVEQARCEPTDAQRWRFDDMELVNGSTATCIALAGDRAALAACGGAGQRFGYAAEREAIVTADGRCLAADGDAVVARACDGTTAQRWLQARGGFVSRANTGRCIQPTGSELGLADCADEPAQRWALRGAIRDARGGLCLSNAGALALATCDGSTAQRWTFWSR